MTTVMIFKNQVHFPKAFWKSVMHIEQIFIRVRVEFQTKTTFNRLKFWQKRYNFLGK